jgi:hypothetical protein
MTHDELDQIVADLVTQLSTQGFEGPMAFAAIERTGRTSSGSSSPTQAGWIEPLPGHVDVEMDRLPIHLLFVDARSRAAHGLIEPSSAASVHLCTWRPEQG